jgi:hypothetical protein
MVSRRKVRGWRVELTDRLGLGLRRRGVSLSSSSSLKYPLVRLPLRALSAPYDEALVTLTGEAVGETEESMVALRGDVELQEQM